MQLFYFRVVQKASASIATILQFIDQFLALHVEQQIKILFYFIVVQKANASIATILQFIGPFFCFGLPDYHAQTSYA